MKKHKLILTSLASMVILGTGFLTLQQENILAAETNTTASATNQDGLMTKDGKTYLFENGEKATGWRMIKVQTPDKKVTEQWLYFDEFGVSQTGWLSYNGSWYYLYDSGKNNFGTMVTQFNRLNGVVYYFSETGEMKQNEWFQDKGNWYYADQSGALKIDDWFVVDGKWYFATNKGMILIDNFIKDKGIFYYCDPSGAMKVNTWFEKNGKWYYASESGAILRNTVTPDGYKVNEKGEWVQ